MGEFVTVSAFRTDDVAAVLAAAYGFFTARDWPAKQVTDTGQRTDDDVLFFPPACGWTVVVWSGYFTELAAVAHMSRALTVLASTVRIHDGDYWAHYLMRDGETLDRFASMPDYFTDDPAEIARLRAEYAGQPAVVAEAVGCPVTDVAPYFVTLDLEEVEDEDGSTEVLEPDMGRAFPDDEFTLDEPWVFIDFWRRLGPRYPDDLSAYVSRLRLVPGWMGKLPGGDAEL